MITVDEIMSSQLYTLASTESVHAARVLMKEKNIRHIPVTDNEALVGIVTERDLLAASESSLYAKSNEERITLEKSHQLKEIMTRDVCTITVNETLKSAALHMRKHKHGCLPVLENNKLVGIVTDTDFVAIAVHLIEQLEETSDFEEKDFMDDDAGAFEQDMIDDLESV